MAKDQEVRVESENGKTKPFHFDDRALIQAQPNVNNGATRNGAYLFTAILDVVVFALAIAICFAVRPVLDMWLIGVGVVFALLFLHCVHINMEWERSIVTRFGRFARVAGPGLVLTIPLVEFVAARVDLRTAATPFSAEETLSGDLVPVDVDAVLFWMVWDPRKACMEVEDYPAAVAWIAQTALRDAMGRITLAEVIARRDQIDLELQKVIAEKTEAWGITVISVEIRDIVIPKDLQDAMSKEAQAERERNARVVLAEVEQDISQMFSTAADVYREDPVAFQLRQMNLVFEGMKDKGNFVLLPTTLAESLKAQISN